jgi:hypothetical protein
MRGRVWILLLFCMAWAVTPVRAGPSPQEPDEEDESAVAPVEDPVEALPGPEARPPHFRAIELPDSPAPGAGRLRIDFAGNRRWCTQQDDRILKPPAPSGRPPAREPGNVITFGYQMVLAAVRRGKADEVILLYESPLIRTASWRPAVKVGLPPMKPSQGPKISESGPPSQPAQRVAPSQLVPYWHEINRCVTVAESMDFDLAPGTYDLYLAIDLLGRGGKFSHRATTFLLDVSVEAGRWTVVSGKVDMHGGGIRDVELLSATPPSTPNPARSAGPSGVKGAATRDP